MRDSDPSGENERANAVLAAELAERTAELARSDTIRRAVALSATELLRSLEPDRSVPTVLELIGTSTGVSRIYVFENEVAADGRIYSSRRFGWDAPGLKPGIQLHKLDHLDAAVEGPGTRIADLPGGGSKIIVTRTAVQPYRELLESLGILSVLIVPIFVDKKWWGRMGFADCITERSWSAIEIDTLKTVSEMIGATMVRARQLRELSDASRIIENSSAILYRLAPKAPYPVTYISRNVSRYGHSASELLASPVRYFDLVHPDDRSSVLVDIARIVEGQDAEATNERRLRAADGHYVWFEARMRAIYDDKNRITAIEGILIDIDDRKLATARLEQFKLTDPVTGLASRTAFMGQFGQVFATAKRGGAPFAIHYLDIDHFKDINDVLGHPKGDDLLKLVAQRLKNVLRATDLIARFGGDEFAILQSDVLDPADAGTLADRILQDIAAPFDIGTKVHISASIGISVFAPEIAEPEEMIKNVDLALYRAKDSGRNQYHFHTGDLDIAVNERVKLAGDLRLALDRGELELYYQPQVEIASGKIVGLEALARWHHPRLGLVCPSRFIPVAEKTDIISALGRWVLEEVCRQIVQWRAEKVPVPIIAINVSAIQLKPSAEFDQMLQQSLRRWEIAPSCLEVELTESVLMETTRENSTLIERLRAIGVSIAIDDFGTGYSSLNYLRMYHVTRLKIAQEFIHDMASDPSDLVIVRAAVSLARELGIQTIAEGVETVPQLDLLAKAGCQYVQGFYYSRPVPAKQAAELLRRGVLGPAPPEPEASQQFELLPQQAPAAPPTSRGGLQ
jgi:diguanylate cyclase (GGDEF)-like protein/PAS domain S-box-containing protein